MEKNGCWNCNQKCLHCYASGEKLSNVGELNTNDWKKVIDILKDCPDDFPVTIYNEGDKYTTEYFDGTTKEALKKYSTWYANDYDKMENGIDIYIIKSK